MDTTARKLVAGGVARSQVNLSLCRDLQQAIDLFQPAHDGLRLLVNLLAEAGRMLVEILCLGQQGGDQGGTQGAPRRAVVGRGKPALISSRETASIE